MLFNDHHFVGIASTASFLPAFFDDYAGGGWVADDADGGGGTGWWGVCADFNCLGFVLVLLLTSSC